MQRRLFLTADEQAGLERLGLRVKLARLRRNLSQEEMAERTGVTRKTFASLEAGRGAVRLGVLAKTLAVFGYPERMACLLESDPLGDEFEQARGPKRPVGRASVADF